MNIIAPCGKPKNSYNFCKKNSKENPFGLQRFFQSNYDGACPCFSGQLKIAGKKTLKVWGRCWRVSENAQDLHIYGNLPTKDLLMIGKVIKSILDRQKWYGNYTIIINNPPEGK